MTRFSNACGSKLSLVSINVAVVAVVIVVAVISMAIVGVGRDHSIADVPSIHFPQCDFVVVCPDAKIVKGLFFSLSLSLSVFSLSLSWSQWALRRLGFCLPFAQRSRWEDPSNTVRIPQCRYNSFSIFRCMCCGEVLGVRLDAGACGYRRE